MLAMLIPLLGPIFDKLIGLIPDPAAAAKAKAEAMQMLIDAAQMEVNKVEAGNSSMFIAGWRPFVGWVCAAGCAWNWIGLPVGMFVVALAGRSLDLRPADLSEMLPLLLGLLGMGGLRTFEKIQGVARETLPRKPAPSAIAEGQG